MFGRPEQTSPFALIKTNPFENIHLISISKICMQSAGENFKKSAFIGRRSMRSNVNWIWANLFSDFFSRACAFVFCAVVPQFRNNRFSIRSRWLERRQQPRRQRAFFQCQMIRTGCSPKLLRNCGSCCDGSVLLTEIQHRNLWLKIVSICRHTGSAWMCIGHHSNWISGFTNRSFLSAFTSYRR